MTSLAELAKASDDTKRKEQVFGLANNAFGASAGLLGTKAVYDAAKEKAHLRNLHEQGLPMPPKEVPKVGRFERLARRAHISPRKALIGAGIAAVGSQLANVGADTQSAYYFGRELSANRKGGRIKEPKPVTAAKAARRFDSEADRRHRQGIYEGLGWTGAAAGAGTTVQHFRRNKIPLARLQQLARARKVPLLATAGGLGSAGVAVASRRAYLHERNQPAWT